MKHQAHQGLTKDAKPRPRKIKDPVTPAQHSALAIWAADCAERVLHHFEQAHPNDTRPREAIATCREFARTGVFSMAVIRKASLSAHAAARACEPNSAAQFAARAAGQAVATAHVPSHAIGGALYGAKAADVAGAKTERAWQYRKLQPALRPFILKLAKERPVIGRTLRYPGMVGAAESNTSRPRRRSHRSG